MKNKIDVDILGWGGYVPIYRISVDEISKEWGENPLKWRKMLGLCEKSVPSLDEDSTTLAVEACKICLKRAQVDPSEITAIYVGTESKAYAVKPTSTIIAQALGLSPSISSADMEFACKAGTEALTVCMSQVISRGGVGLAIGTDTAQGRPKDPLEYSAGAGAAAFILGSKHSKRESAAKILFHYSYVTDTPDFWRKNGDKYPCHAERFTGSPAYFKHTVNAARTLMKTVGTNPSDYQHVIFHQPNGKFPLKAAKLLGFVKKQLKYGLLVDKIGNTYSANSLLGLVSVLDNAAPGDKILLVSFGSGAGSDAFHLEVQEGISEKKRLALPLEKFINRKINVSYGSYVRKRAMLYV